MAEQTTWTGDHDQERDHERVHDLDHGLTPAGLPRRVTNPVMGESVTFLETGDETGGAHVRVRCDVPAGAQGPPMHYHLDFDEHFRVLEGTLLLDVADRRRLALGPGEEATATRGTHHRFFNDGDQPVVFEAVMTPASTFELAIRASYGLARDGRTTRTGVPRDPFVLALAYELSGTYLVGVPHRLQVGVFGLLARLARGLGYDPRFRQYTEAPGAGGEAPRPGRRRTRHESVG